MTAKPAYLANTAPQNADAFARFMASGLPSVKNENWRYTNLHALEKQNFAAPVAFNGTLPSTLFPPTLMRLVFVNGVLDEKMSLGTLNGLHVTRGSAPALRGDSWLDLNAALSGDAYLLKADANMGGAIELMFVGAGHVRLHVELEAEAKLMLVERHMAQQTGFTTQVSSFAFGKNARLMRVVAADLGQNYSLFHDETDLNDGALADFSYIHANGKLTRRNAAFNHNASGSNLRLRAVNLAPNHSHIDLLTDMRHKAPNTQSRQDIRAIAGESSRTVFQGKVLVEQAAQKTDASQTHHGLLLADNAECDAKPGLEIYADDVKCAHGATCGALDEQALFYLQSRGIPRLEAEKLLLRSFAASIFEDMPAPELGKALRKYIKERLGEADAAA